MYVAQRKGLLIKNRFNTLALSLKKTLKVENWMNVSGSVVGC